MNQSHLSKLLAAPVFVVLSACGGGGNEEVTTSLSVADADVDIEVEVEVEVEVDDSAMLALEAPSQPTQAAAARSARERPPAAQPIVVTEPNPAINPNATDSERMAAATATAQSTTNVCSPVRPFYWEIGNGSAKLVSGSVNSSTSTLTITSTKLMSVASASKWIYGAYVAQQRNGVLSADDVSLLSMRGGYTNFDACLSNQTVDSCLAYGTNGVYDPNTAGKYSYGGGHMQKHASTIGLGSMNSKALANAVMGQIGTDVKLGYGQPQLAGGMYTSADSYARFLRKVIRNDLKIGGLLGSSAACTNKSTCGSGQALYAPIPPNESWHYSIGHWIEDDPLIGDGAFSSAGALGFYPWIDASRTIYGVVARSVPGGAFDSVKCGRLIRKAWMSATTL